MFPERQSGPHRDWKEEVNYLDKHFSNGAAYTVGKMNGDHWLLYLTNPEDQGPSSPLLSQNGTVPLSVHSDYTIEILMSGLSPSAREPFFNSDLSESADAQTALAHGRDVSSKLGISDIFPPHLTNLDAYSFVPCGYSSNALIRWGEESLETDCPPAAKHHSGEGYYTIHVTPEEGWSYASFECNVPLSVTHTSPSSEAHDAAKMIPTLKELIRRVVSIFQPTRLSLTLFISAEENESAEGELTPVELAQKSFKAALDEIPPSSGLQRFKRTDKINYEFGGYDLAFASFELK
jgi:S-adenosylmethionine decarboxylase